MLRKIKKFEPLSVMRISAICYGIMGIVEGAFFSMIFAAVPMTPPNGQPMPHFFRLLFGSFSILIFPIFFALIGAVTGVLGAVVYNVSAHYVGGIAVEVE
jgi:hypothetical protein